jgi:hypothetical protein
VSGTDKYTGFFIDWVEDWSQFFGPCNWYTFRPILIEFEDDRAMGGIEATVIVLGLGFRARFNYARPERVAEYDASFAEFMAKIETVSSIRTPQPNPDGGSE